MRGKLKKYIMKKNILRQKYVMMLRKKYLIWKNTNQIIMNIWIVEDFSNENF